MNSWLRAIADAIRDNEDGDWEDMSMAVAEAMLDVTDEMECAGEGLEGVDAFRVMVHEGMEG